MYKLCKTEQSAKRQREIEKALFELMREKPYGEITVTEICDALSMPRKAFYRYFDSKEDTLYALIEHTMAEYNAFFENGKSTRVRTLKSEIEKYFTFWRGKEALLDVLHENNMLEKIIEASVAFPINDIVSMKKFLPEDSDWARERVVKFAVCGLAFQMLDWYKDGFKTSVSDMARLSCRTLSKPLFPDLERHGIIVE